MEDICQNNFETLNALRFILRASKFHNSWKICVKLITYEFDTQILTSRNNQV